MKAKPFRLGGLSSVVALAVVIVSIALACSPVEDPFEYGDRAANRTATAGTPTSAEPSSSPVPLPTEPPEAAATRTAAREQQRLDDLFIPTVGTIRLGEWKDDKVRQLQNYIVGYIMVYGYNYTVELVETGDQEYKDALTKGAVDVVLDSDGDWISGQMASGSVVDAGTIKSSDAGSRIGVNSSLHQNSPEIGAFLSKLSPGDEQVADLASMITGGRTGIRNNVAALMYLKRHRDRWTSWVPASVVDKVDAAIEKGKTTLVNRICVPDGAAGCAQNCC